MQMKITQMLDAQADQVAKELAEAPQQTSEEDQGQVPTPESAEPVGDSASDGEKAPATPLLPEIYSPPDESRSRSSVFSTLP